MFSHKIEVRFNDFDGMGHVNNATFLTYLEIARINYIKYLLETYNLDRKNYDFILAQLSINYKTPIEVQFINAEIGVTKVGNSSFDFNYRLYDDQNVFATATSVQVSYNYKKRSKVTIPDELRKILETEKENNTLKIE